MTSTEVVVVESASLALDPEQTAFTPAQVAALEHIGVEDASPGDLQVFHHVCQRSGLDPFARQIHMIARQNSVFDQESNRWTKVTKWTIQTGIDGFRLIGRRAADRAGHKVAKAGPEWCTEEGEWRPVWRKVWGYPIAARVTIYRDGEPFPATALFDEYAQTKRSGELSAMWEQRPAGQLAKCAEALAWRTAFPQDLSGIYTDDEMGQAESLQHVRGDVVEQRGLGAALAAQQTSGPGESPASSSSADSDVVVTSSVPPGPESSGPEDSPKEDAVSDAVGTSSEPSGSEPPPGGVTAAQLRNIGRLMGKSGLDITDRDEALGYVSSKVARPVASRNELSKSEAGVLIDALEADLALLKEGGQS